MRQESGGRYVGQLRTISTKANIDDERNVNKSIDSHPDFRVLTYGIEVATCRTVKSGNSNKLHVNVSPAISEFGPKKLYANLGRAAGWDDENLCAMM